MMKEIVRLAQENNLYLGFLIPAILVIIYMTVIYWLRKKSHLLEVHMENDLAKVTLEKGDNMMKDILTKSSASSALISKDLDAEEKLIYDFLKLHHEQALKQSNIQFWFSIMASIVGFIFIILITVTSNNSAWYEYILKTLPGVIVEAVSVLFISQAKETRDRATNFFSELNYEMQIAKSVEIADSIENEEVRADIKSKIALHIVGIDNK